MSSSRKSSFVSTSSCSPKAKQIATPKLWNVENVTEYRRNPLLSIEHFNIYSSNSNSIYHFIVPNPHSLWLNDL
ncbi:hypothetical protein T12_9622 [Trichinella patagoniensis]|uniref:Uncharacterized protein n=1 Tax=Trichinella patagoniensis TaxID=990121 RepID=A0A0V0ZUI7_9BILA|nr:hypothetical protein T12_9622 [Trichinella patagoniensis]